MKIESYIKRGNSFPIILEDSGKKYFVKLRGGMSGKYALINEWIGNKLGSQMAINTQTPIWIHLPHDMIIGNIYIEVKELIYKSLGTNIGFLYREQAIEVKGDELSILEQQEAENIFLYDLMMLNIDRTTNNTNLMRVNNEIVTLDYEASLLFQDVIGNKNLIENNGILKCFKHSPLYREIDEASIDRFVEKIEQISMEAVIAEIPAEILGKEERNLFLKGIEHKMLNQWFLKETMERLKNIQMETQEEQKSRILRNQEIFKENLRNNTNG